MLREGFLVARRDFLFGYFGLIKLRVTPFLCYLAPFVLLSSSVCVCAFGCRRIVVSLRVLVTWVHDDSS